MCLRAGVCVCHPFGNVLFVPMAWTKRLRGVSVTGMRVTTSRARADARQ